MLSHMTRQKGRTSKTKLVAWQNKPSELITGPINLQADIYLMPPKKYHTGPKRALIASGELRSTTKPDADNLI